MFMDFLASKPRLGIESEKSYKTYLGTLLSVLSFVLVTSASLYFGREVWEKHNPIVNTVKYYSEVPEILAIDKKVLDLGFGLDHDFNYVNDLSIISVHPYLLSQQNETYFSTPFNLEICNSESFYGANNDYFSKYPTNGLFCIPKSEELSLNKAFGQENFRVIVVEFYPCTNSSESTIICKSQDVIDEILSQMYFSIYSLDYTVDTSNYTYPYVKTLFNDYISISQDSFVDFTMFISHLSVISDVGFLFTSEVEQKSFSIYSIKNMFSLRKQSKGMFLSFGIQLHNYQTIYYRKYIKLQELMAQIGGIANMLFIISRIINYYPSALAYQSYLVNRFYDFHDPSTSNSLSLYLNLGNKLINFKKERDFERRQPKISYFHFGNKHLHKDYEPVYALSHNSLESFFLCFKSKTSNFKRHFISKGYEILSKAFTIETLIENYRVLSAMQLTLITEKEKEILSKIRYSLISSGNLSEESISHSNLANIDEALRFPIKGETLMLREN